MILLRDPVYTRCNQRIDAMHARMRRASLIASVYFNPFDIHVFIAYHASSSIDSNAKGEKKKK